MAARSCSVAVVGGGVIGASIAYHLSSRGMRDVVVLDRAAGPGAGSTGRATGGFRIQFAGAPLIALSRLSREKLRSFHDETGGDAGFVAAGYLWLAEDDSELETLRAALGVQRAHGVAEACEVSAAEIAELNPAVRRAPLAGGTFCAADGFIAPLGILEGYRRAAERSGAHFAWDAEVTGFSRGRDGRIVRVRTRERDLAPEWVVNAAGAWAADVAALCGIALPVRAERRFVAVTVPTALLPARMPMTLYAGDGFHFRVRDGRVVLLLPPRERDARGEAVDERWLDAIATLAAARVPALRGTPIDRAACWSGLYEMTPDALPIIDVAPGAANLCLANGSSGHGVMHAPAIGHLVADVIGGAEPSLDLTPFRADRFTRPARTAELL